MRVCQPGRYMWIESAQVCTCYHPLICFNYLGDLERVLLRNGNVASADDWRSVLERQIQHLPTRPVGRPPKKPVVRYHDFMYRAGSCDRENCSLRSWIASNDCVP